MESTPQSPADSAAATPAMVSRRLNGAALASVLAALMVTLLLSALDQTIVATALPTIVSELNGVELYTWVVTAYLLTSTTVIPLVSKLSDQFGRKWLLLGAVVIFLIGSALSGASQTMNELIAFRALQGIGGGALATLVFTLIGDIFSPADRARWQGLFSGVFGLASVVGPTLGGWIVDHTTWRWIFYVNIPLGIIALGLLFFYLPANISIRSAARGQGSAFRRIDWGGAITAAVGTVLLLVGLTWGGVTYPWASWQVIGSLVGAGVFFIAFFFAETRASEPILPLDLFKNQIFAAGSALSLMVGMTLFAVVLYLPVYLQGVLGVKATNSGIVITPLVVTLAIAAALVGFLIARVGRYQWISIIGAVIMTVGFYLLSTMSISTTQQMVVIYMIILGVGMGFLQPVLTLSVQNAIPQHRLGAGTGAVTYLRNLGSTLGAAVIGAIVINASEANLNPKLAAIPNSDQLTSGLRAATNSLTNTQALQGLLTVPSFKQQALEGAVKAANSSPQAQQAINQAIQQAQQSPQTQQAIQEGVAKATATIPPTTPGYQQIVANITKQVTDAINQAIAAKVPAQVHEAITTNVTNTFNQVLDAGRLALAHGIQQAYFVSIFLAIIVVIITLFLKDVPLRTSMHVSMAEGAEAAFESQPEAAAESVSVSGQGAAETEVGGDKPDIEAAPAFGMEGM